MAAAWGLREVHAIIHRFIRGIAMDVFPTKIALSRRRCDPVERGLPAMRPEQTQPNQAGAIKCYCITLLYCFI
jgi:hypothetical protein